MAVLIETSLGDITVDLFTEERPRSTLNFLKLCKIKYYNFSLFHSVQRNLVAQTGDPTGTGRGGQSVFAHLYGDQAVYFDMETVPRIKHRQKGLVSMVNNGNNGHGSQFFFTLEEDLDYLDGVHTVIGEVSEGIDVLDKINEAYCDEQHRPYKDIRIYHTIILDDPYADPDGLVVPDRSPEPTKEQLDSGRIRVDEDIDDTKGMTEVEIQESMEKKEAQANAQILEMVGDLPDADVRPPDTVLFVCKLNPVTTSEDLEIIFSRFGTITSCDVIKDQKSGESLQYAFIEFEKPEDCESAYFKMDNVLIDDRRIHVDFSQSVSKIRFEDVKGGGKGAMFSSKYKIKDNSKKDNKYDLVFEEGSGAGRQQSRDKGRREERTRRTSRSRSRDRSPIGTKKERRNSRSPVHRERESKSLKMSPKSKHRSPSEGRSQKFSRDKDNRKHQKKRGSSSDSSDDDGKSHRRREKAVPSRDKKNRVNRSQSESDSDRDVMNSKSRSKAVDKHRKSENTRKQHSPESDSDSDSPKRRKKQKKNKSRDRSSDQLNYSSDERSKAKSRSEKSTHKKSKHKDSDSDSNSSHTKSKKRRADSRERIKESKHDRRDRDKGRDRDSQERRDRHRDSERYRDRR